MKVTHVQTDNWEAVYIEGILLYQHHNIDLEDVVAALGHEYEYYWLDPHKMGVRTGFPDEPGEWMEKGFDQVEPLQCKQCGAPMRNWDSCEYCGMGYKNDDWDHPYYTDMRAFAPGLRCLDRAHGWEYPNWRYAIWS